MKKIIPGFSILICAIVISCATEKKVTAPPPPKQEGTVKWEVRTLGQTARIAFIEKDRLIVTAGEYMEFGTPNRLLYSIDTETGKVIWNKDTGDNHMSSVPGLHRSYIYWKNEKGGADIYSFTTGSWIKKSYARFPDTTVHNLKACHTRGSALICEGDGEWTFKTKGKAVNVIETNKSVSFADTGDRTIYSLDKMTGERLWKYGPKKISTVKYPDAVNFNFTVRKSSLFIAEYDGSVKRIDFPQQ